jgi:S1-C subfamily serine protease
VAAIVLVGFVFLAWQRLGERGSAPAPGAAASDPVGSVAPAAQPAAARPSSRQLASRALAAAAALRCSDSVGSGVFVASDLVLTNAHVLCRPGESVQVSTSDERTYQGEVLRRDDRLDLGLVRVTGASVTPLALGDVGELGVGDRIVIVGSPVGLDFSVQEGSISSLQRSTNGVAYLQLDAKVSPGNSGGPVIDAQGRVVGIVSMKVTGQGVEGIGLAIPINYSYSASLAYVSPPSQAAAASEGFQRMLARAQQGTDDGLREARADAPEAAPSFDGKPLLVAGRVDQYGNLVVRVVRIAEFPPGFEEITVTVYNGLEPFCTMKGDIASWQKVDAAVAASGPGLDPRVGVGLRRIAGSQPIYVGESPLRWDLCDRTQMRSGIQIELSGASAIASRLTLR